MDNIHKNYDLKKSNNPLRKEVIADITKRTGQDQGQIENVLSYNCIPLVIFAELCGVKVHAVEFLARPRQFDGKLVCDFQVAYPFWVGEKKGPKFIILDDKAREYLIKNNTGE